MSDNPMRFKWPDLLSDYTGKKWTAGESQRWMDELRGEVDQYLSDEEICNAIRLRSYKDQPMRFPTVKDLRIWVCSWRGRKATNDKPKADPEFSKDWNERMAAIYKAIDDAETSTDMWSAIFFADPLGCGARDKAEEYARKNRPNLFETSTEGN